MASGAAIDNSKGLLRNYLSLHYHPVFVEIFARQRPIHSLIIENHGFETLAEHHYHNRNNNFQSANDQE